MIPSAPVPCAFQRHSRKAPGRSRTKVQWDNGPAAANEVTPYFDRPIVWGRQWLALAAAGAIAGTGCGGTMSALADLFKTCYLTGGSGVEFSAI